MEQRPTPPRLKRTRRPKIETAMIVRPTPQVDPAAALDGLSDFIRMTWIHEMRQFEVSRTRRPSSYAEDGVIVRWDGGEDGYGRVHQPIWPSLAELCVSHRLNPRHWVQTLFAYWRTTKHRGRNRPTPADLKSSDTLQKYESRKGEIIRMMENQHQVQKHTAAIKLHELSKSCMKYTAEQAARWVIKDLTISLSPLFRVAMAYAANQPDAADEFFVDAVVEYTFDSDIYDQLWNQAIPAKIRDASVHLRRELRIVDGGQLLSDEVQYDR